MWCSCCTTAKTRPCACSCHGLLAEPGHSIHSCASWSLMERGRMKLSPQREIERDTKTETMAPCVITLCDEYSQRAKGSHLLNSAVRLFSLHKERQRGTKRERERKGERKRRPPCSTSTRRRCPCLQTMARIVVELAAFSTSGGRRRARKRVKTRFGPRSAQPPLSPLPSLLAPFRARWPSELLLSFSFYLSHDCLFFD